MPRQTNSVTDEVVSYHYDDPLCFQNIQQAVYGHLLAGATERRSEPVYLCIGTDRATGDCLGPLVGSRLNSLVPAAQVYGTLEKPTHAMNLAETLEVVRHLTPQATTVAIDACLGRVDRIGFINVKKGRLKPGTALQKELPSVGDFHVSGVVNVGGWLDHLVLQNTRFYVVYRMAEIIAKGLATAHLRYIGYQAHSC